MKLLTILEDVLAVNTLLVQMVTLIDTPGCGPEKKADVMAHMQDALNALPIGTLLKRLLSNDAVLGILIELTLKAVKRAGTPQEARA
jgi:hypothetical protein